jgi:AraC-like DNA-binding protein
MTNPAMPAPRPVVNLAGRPQVAGTGFVEQIHFGAGFFVSVDRYRLTERLDTLVPGEDMVKFHVRLSGRRLLSFDRRDPLALEDLSMACLLHENGTPKTDHILANHDEASITIAMKRERFLEYLDVANSEVPAVLNGMLKRYARGPRLATTRPSGEEVDLARAIIGCRRTGPLRRMYLEAKTLELMVTVLDHLEEPEETPAASVRLTERTRRQLHLVRELLESTFVEPARINELARLSGLNRNKLCTGFRMLFGVSIFDFCSGLRLEHGRRLLLESHLSVLEIALASGYSSASAFSTAFQRRYAFAPTEVRARARHAEVTLPRWD